MTGMIPILDDLLFHIYEHAAGPPVAGVLLLGIGLLYLLWGWRLYRLVLVITLVLVGGAIGGGVARQFGWHPLWLGLPFGVIAGLLVAWAERFGAFVLGGMAGVLPVIVSRPYFATPHTYAFAVLAAFLLAGSFTVIYLHPMIVLASAFVGAACMENAVLIVLEAALPGFTYRVVNRYPALMIGPFFAIVVVGILHQTRTPPKETDGVRQDADGTPPPG